MCSPSSGIVRDTTRAELGQLTGLSRTAVAARVAALMGSAWSPRASRRRRPAAARRPCSPSTPTRASCCLRGDRHQPHPAGGVQPGRRDRRRLSDIDQEVALGPDDLMPDVVKRLDVLLQEHRGRAGLRRRAEPARYRRPRTRLQPGLADPARLGRRRAAAVLRRAATAFGRPGDARQRRQRDRARRARRELSDDVCWCIKASSGLGAGIVAGGVLQRGAAQAAGEFGHNKIAAAQGLPCRCGDTGCLEAIAGGWALVHAAAAAGPLRAAPARRRRAGSRRRRRGAADDPRQRPVRRRGARRGGEPAQPGRRRRRGRHGGGLRDLRRRTARDVVRQRHCAWRPATLEVVPAAHGSQSGMVGGAVMVLDEVLSARAVDALAARTTPSR